jgi:hypothetical protein
MLQNLSSSAMLKKHSSQMFFLIYGTRYNAKEWNPLLLVVVQYLTWPDSHLGVSFSLPQPSIVIGF